MIKFTYKVLPENRCAGLEKYPEDHIFEGFVQYSNLYKEFYLTIDQITYTACHKAYEVKQIGSIEEEIWILGILEKLADERDFKERMQLDPFHLVSETL